MKATYKGREIEVELDNVHYYDYPDFVDAFVCSAYYVDTGKDLSDDEIEDINNSDLVYGLVFDSIY
jgi:hypothetical protein